MPTVPAAVSSRLRDVLGADPVRTQVAYLGRDRAYVRVGDRLLVLSTGADADPLPCTVLAPSLSALPVAGTPVVVGASRVSWGCTRLVTSRWWAPAVVRRSGRAPGGSAALRRLLSRHAARLPVAQTEGVRRAAAALAAGRPAVAGDRLAAGLGLGEGSTPALDDAVAGLLLTARALVPDAVLAEVAAPVLDALAVTTPLSAELLRHAADGCATARVVRAVQTLVAPPDAHAAVAAAESLMLLGHTSGAATALGVLAALDHLSPAAEEAA